MNVDVADIVELQRRVMQRWHAWARRRPEVLRLYGRSFVYEDVATAEVLFMSPEVLFMSLEFYLHCRWQSSLPLVYIMKVG